MNWKTMNKNAVLLFINGKVTKVLDSERMGDRYQVDYESINHVGIITRKNHNEIQCDCRNCQSAPKDKRTICVCQLAVQLYAQRYEVFK